ncbi:ABC transporter permease [Faecalimonas hominis]
MKEFWKFKSLLYELICRDIKIKYRRSILGVLWTVLNPLLMMTILYLVFSKLFRFDIENYAIYVLSGQVIFNYYQSSTTDAMMAILGNSSLIKKVYLPKYMLVLAKILSGAVNLFASFIALLVVMIVTGFKLSPIFLWSVVPLFCLIILSFGVGLALAAITVRFRDILHLYGVFCMALFYLTPVIYPFSILPEYMRKVVYYNPITRIMDSFRMIMIDSAVPSNAELYYCLASAGVTFLAGAWLFHKRQQKFILDL